MVGSIFMQSRHTKFKLGYRSDWDQPRCQRFIVQLDLTCKLEATLRVNMYVKVVLLFKWRAEVTQVSGAVINLVLVKLILEFTYQGQRKVI